MNKLISFVLAIVSVTIVMYINPIKWTEKKSEVVERIDVSTPTPTPTTIPERCPYEYMFKQVTNVDGTKGTVHRVMCSERKIVIKLENGEFLEFRGLTMPYEWKLEGTSDEEHLEKTLNDTDATEGKLRDLMVEIELRKKEIELKEGKIKKLIK